MSDLAGLYARNAAFAETFSAGDLPITTKLNTVILTCVDARVDPAHFARLEPGDALVMRTVGGRVTAAVRRELAVLWMLMAAATGSTPDMELVIIHHTKCGMARFADPAVAARVTERFGTPEVVDTYAIADPADSLATDVARLRADTTVPRELPVSGHVYDVESGRLTQVVAPASLGGGGAPS